MQWNGEDQANAAVQDAPAMSPLGAAGPFDRPHWFDRLAALHPGVGARCDARGQGAGAAAWLPLAQRGPKHLVSLANWYSFAHRPLFGGARSKAAQESALIDLFAGLRARAERITLYPVPEIDGSDAMVCTALRASGWWVVAVPAGDSHWLDLAGADHDGWWAARPGALRSTIARKAKKNIVDITLTSHWDAALWADYEAIYAASWKPEEGNPALLRAFAHDEADAGRARFGLARIDGAAVAAQFWTVENGCAFIHKLAHVEDSIKASPGSLLSAALFRHVITIDHVRRVDFGTGNDPYKRDWMNRHNRLWRIEAFNPARPLVWAPAIAAMLRRRQQQETR
jgi:hypothetical protein